MGTVLGLWAIRRQQMKMQAARSVSATPTRIPKASIPKA